MIDLAHLARYTGGEARLDAEVLDLFSRQTAQMLDRLVAAFERPDVKEWHEITHSLKGASNGIGAFALGEAAASAEAIDPSLEHVRAAEALLAVQRCAAIVRSFIDTYLDR